MLVIKRNGERVEFDVNKIRLAITRANDSIEEKDRINEQQILDITKTVWYRCGNDAEISVEEIQDLVESELVKRGYYVLGKAYIKYRYIREMARNRYSELMDAIEEKLTARNVQNQNANVDERSFGGRIGEMTSMVMRQYALDYCMSEKAKRNHIGNRVYIHDLDQYAVGSHNCLSIPFDDLLANGFKTRQTDVRPANSVNTALQLVAVIFQLQSLNQFGGVSATHLDWTMVPYIRKSFAKHYRVGLADVENIRACDIDYEIEAMLNDATSYPIDDEEYMNYAYNAWVYAMERTSVEIYQGVEALFHNLNTLQSRSGNQLPFTSLNLGTCTLTEGRMFTRALLECSIKGLGRFHKTSIFPCSIFQLMKGVNREPGDPNYDLYQLALRSTAQRLYPNYANVDWSGNAGYDRNDPRTYFSTMGCRTSNGADINAEPGVNPQTKDGRGNACPVTIILPTLAMEARQQVKSGEDVVDVFMEILNTAIDDAKDALLERFEYICSQSAASARFMYENGTMMGYKPEEGIRSALKHCTLALGQLGLAETLEILVGCNHLSSVGMEVAKRIEQLFKEKCAAFKQQYRLNFGVYYTPAENLCYTAMAKFREKYGIIPKVSENLFFTNSIHVPVWEEVTAFEKIDIESQLTSYSSAGCITYVELDAAAKNNLEALETIVNYAMDKDIPYFAINVPVDNCQDCGYTDEIGNTCPQCGGTHIERLRRVTGYLTGSYLDAFNLGKQQEVEMRYRHVQGGCEDA